KNTFGKTRAAAVPYRKKSYHSMVVPTVLAATARIRLVRTSELLAGGGDAGGGDAGGEDMARAPCRFQLIGLLCPVASALFQVFAGRRVADRLNCRSPDVRDLSAAPWPR